MRPPWWPGPELRSTGLHRCTHVLGVCVCVQLPANPLELLGSHVHISCVHQVPAYPPEASWQLSDVFRIGVHPL